VSTRHGSGSPGIRARLVWALAGAALAGGIATVRGESGPPTGDWQVVEVLVDQHATRTLGYGPNDPRLRYRIATIETDRVALESPEHASCEQPSWRERETAVAPLWRAGFAGRGEAPEWPTAADYGLPLRDAQVVHVLSITCGKGSFGPDVGEETGNWMMPLPDDRMAVRWYDQTVLILRRLARTEKPEASFDCSRAATATESAICASHVLAGFDRSISEAYAAALKSNRSIAPAGSDRLIASQRAWLRTRDACGGDVRCLGKAMRQRLDRLAALPG
jgi:uncharacterized protein YecT (DUF1311 family)